MHQTRATNFQDDNCPEKSTREMSNVKQVEFLELKSKAVDNLTDRQQKRRRRKLNTFLSRQRTLLKNWFPFVREWSFQISDNWDWVLYVSSWNIPTVLFDPSDDMPLWVDQPTSTLDLNFPWVKLHGHENEEVSFSLPKKHLFWIHSLPVGEQRRKTVTDLLGCLLTSVRGPAGIVISYIGPTVSTFVKEMPVWVREVIQ